jgi:hypothetical protein
MPGGDTVLMPAVMIDEKKTLRATVLIITNDYDLRNGQA